ncbi:glycosyltransferase family 4 protein [Tianweitania sp. BSSL-BM11]|uniref:Glycosyltransferase family 4 protein n=1 Tax=Tianweitania aestuarii TaxID=2814886 RepID=A0ABS5RXW7_9HYPH|nr:glycosyltransferase family 4 protein [Tianweitania aestuarii]MBS9721884.1 glycosyltransferase family 4 protein [Tianweitania aestuarii]
MTVDAVGGVWRYAMDLAAGLQASGVHFIFVGLGPNPSPAQRSEAERWGKLIWEDAQLDWLAEGPQDLADLPALLERLVGEEGVDLLHLNAPSQACGLKLDCPIVAMSHSCVVTWMHAVRGQEVPAQWSWQKRLNREGFDAADVVLAPSRSHADALEQCYGPIDALSVVYNASQAGAEIAQRQPFVFAAGRWWDEGKNGAVLDDVAGQVEWPVQLAGALKGPNGQQINLQQADHLGVLPTAQIQELMKAAGIFVSPSLYEPFGLAPLEAACTATPLVLADIPTYRELWDGAALFASPRDPASFVEALQTLIASETLRRDMGRKALDRAKRYSLQAQAQAMLQIYDAVCVAAEPRLVLSS